MVTDEKDTEQTKRLETEDLAAWIRRLRALGYTYRQIAQITHSSIAHISRVLKPPAIPTKDESGTKAASEFDGELASKLFTHFKNSRSLIDVVIEEKLPPEIVKKYFQKWGELKSSHVDPKGLTLLWHIFDTCQCLHELALYTLDSSARNRIGTKEALVRIIVRTSEISMEDAYEMLDITQMTEKWSTVEEFYSNARSGYMEDLRKIWHYHHKG